jgi:hypothetical protein
MPSFRNIPLLLCVALVLAAIHPVHRARAQEPGAGEPGTEEPVAGEPVAEEPVDGEPVAEEPVAEEPVEETETEPPAEPATEPEASLPARPAEEPEEPSPEPKPTSEVRLEQLTVQAAEPAASAAPAVKKTAAEKPAAPQPKEREKPERWPRFEFGARLMTGWELQTERPSGEQRDDDRTDHGFFLDQARIGFRARLHKRILANVSAELADAVRPERGEEGFSGVPYLRNAYLNLRFYKKVLQLRVGRFKRPFSRLENRSTGVLPFRGRGLINGLVVENAQWGDRELGMMLWGRLRAPRLAWYVSLSNPDWQPDEDLENQGADLLARLVYSPAKWLSIGANGGHKVIKSPSGAVESFNAMGGDFRVKTGNVYLAAEALAGQLPDEEGRPFAFGITGYGSYDVALSEDYTLQPAVFLEYADANAELLTTEAIRAIAGLNLLWLDRIRLMPQVELVRPLGRVSEFNPWFAGESFYLLLKVTI